MQPSEGDGPAEIARLRLDHALSLFSRIVVAIDDDIGRLSRARNSKEPSTAVHKALGDAIRQAERAINHALDAQRRLERLGVTERDGALDLEGARAEILGRLARLADCGGTEQVS